VSWAGPILLMALAGILVGGAVSLRRNGKLPAAVVTGILAAAAFGGGLYLVYG